MWKLPKVEVKHEYEEEEGKHTSIWKLPQIKVEHEYEETNHTSLNEAAHSQEPRSSSGPLQKCLHEVENIKSETIDLVSEENSGSLSAQNLDSQLQYLLHDKSSTQIVETKADTLQEHASLNDGKHQSQKTAAGRRIGRPPLSSEERARREAEKASKVLRPRGRPKGTNKATIMKRQNDKLQMEVMQVRLLQAESLDDELEGENEDHSIYTKKYERVAKELRSSSKKQLQQQHAEEMELHLQYRQFMERRMQEMVGEAVELRRLLRLSKKENQQLTSEKQDLKLQLEELMSRNNELERK